VADGLGRLLGRHLEDAEAELGNAISVVQVQKRDRCCLSCHIQRLTGGDRAKPVE
jgi:hypothetical protein